MNKWSMYKLPNDMAGMTFLDIGCWEGDNCAEACRRRASTVVGIDLCTCESLLKNVQNFGFEFIQMDIFSEKFFQLGHYDVVLCSGVLYHVENVISLLFRLRSVVNKLLILETSIVIKYENDPILFLATHDDPSQDNSVWWRPNKKGLFQMLELCGFEDTHVVYERVAHKENINRLCIHTKPSYRPLFKKALPRRDSFMQIYGGERKKSNK